MPKVISDDVVFRATLTTLLKHGYAGATTRSIADAAGINEATLFRKYGSKPELVVRAIRGHAYALEEGRLAYSGDIAADLLGAAEYYAETILREGHLFPLIMSEMARNPALRDTVSAPHGVIRALATLMGQYQDEGVLVTDEDPLQAVASFLGPLIVIAMLQSASPRIAPHSLNLESHVQRFLSGRARA